MTTAEQPSTLNLEPSAKSDPCDPKMKIAAKTLNIYITITLTLFSRNDDRGASFNLEP
jgi:hypothetical protein